MSRSFGGRSFTTRSPIVTVPREISSRPATIRSAVVLPHPDGPTKTMNSPSPISRSSSDTASVPSAYTFETPLSAICATAPPSGLTSGYPEIEHFTQTSRRLR